MEPNTLLVKWPSSPGQIYRAGNSYLSDSAQFNSRTPQDIQKDEEAFANLYKNFALTLSAKLEGKNQPNKCLISLLSKMVYVEWLY
jgi:hypothetical protein